MDRAGDYRSGDLRAEITELSEMTELSLSGICWSSVIAGAIAALALTLVLLWLGTGMGFTVVSPWGDDAGVSAKTFKYGTAVYLAVVTLISSAVGGYIAGRLRTRWTGVHSDEVYFRDTVNGFLSWAIATIIGALLLSTVASSIIGSTASGLTQAAGTAAAQSAGPVAGYVDQLLRSDQSTTVGQSGGQSGGSDDIRSELMRLLSSSFGSGQDVQSVDRTYIAQIVARRTGLNQAEAEKRVNDVTTQAKSALDTARSAAAQLAFGVTIALLIGALSASIAAAMAGKRMDRNWQSVR